MIKSQTDVRDNISLNFSAICVQTLKEFIGIIRLRLICGRS